MRNEERGTKSINLQLGMYFSLSPITYHLSPITYHLSPEPAISYLIKSSYTVSG